MTKLYQKNDLFFPPTLAIVPLTRTAMIWGVVLFSPPPLPPKKNKNNNNNNNKN